MISIKMTENLTGVTIRGDFDDFYELVDAFYEITISDDSVKHRSYIDMSIRLLGTCYDIRHAYMGDRDIVLIENNLSNEKKKWRGVSAPTHNVYYECNCLFPEMIFVTIALNELIEIRIKELTKKTYISYDAYSDKKVIWDRTISVLRGFQSAFAECMREALSPIQYSRWLNVITKPYLPIVSMLRQYIDVLNIEYIEMTKEKRLKNLNSITKRIADYWHNDDYVELAHEISMAAKHYECQESQIELIGLDYPEEIEW